MPAEIRVAKHDPSWISLNKSDLPEWKTLVEMLRWRARSEPEHRAYTFLLDGENATAHFTHRELDQHARRIAAQLQQANAYGERVLLLYPPGLEYLAAFFGCLYAGAIGVPAYPPPLNKPAPRIQAMVADAGAKIALTIGAQLAKLQRWFGEQQHLQWFATDELAVDADDWREPNLAGDTIAFLQYTSGSTAMPRGVMVTHRNLLHNLELIRECFGHTRASQGVIWLPPYHDMGLIGGALQPLYAGFPVVLMPPTAFLSSPIRWLRAITRYRGTTSGGPNFAFDLCVRKISAEQRATLDLSSWDVAFNGAEPVRAETLERFSEAFAPCGFRPEAFYPCYGLAEATLIVTGGKKLTPPRVRYFNAAALEKNRVVPTDAHAENSRVLVGCGAPLRGETLKMVNPETRVEYAPDEIGEIWVAGPSVASGYWDRAAETKETFCAELEHQKFLRTGDLGFLQDGELFVAGRLKDLIIIRGRNHYPHDIEQTVESSHPALEPSSGAAFSIEVGGEEKLVIVNELKREQRRADGDEIARAIRAAVSAQHELQVYAIRLLKPGGIPRTSSGKIQRYAARSAFLSNALNVIAAWDWNDVARAETRADDSAHAQIADPRQRQLVLYLRAQIATNLGITDSAIDWQKPLASLGLDSLALIELKLQIEQDLNASLDELSLAEAPSIIALAQQLISAPTIPNATGIPPTQSAALREVPRLRRLVSRLLLAGARAAWEVDARGVENLPSRGAFLLCPNHESAFDHLWIASVLPAPRVNDFVWTVKQEAFDSRIGEFVINALVANIHVDRFGDPEPALREALNVLRAGLPIVIYPEGTRSRTGELGAFKPGAAWLALASGAPLVPTRIDGAFELYPRESSLPRIVDWGHRRRYCVRVSFGTPIVPPRGASGREAEIRLTNALRKAVIALER